MTSSLRFFGVIGPPGYKPADCAFRYLSALFAAEFDICAMPIGAAPLNTPADDGPLARWVPLFRSGIFNKPPAPATYNVVCADMSMTAGRDTKSSAAPGATPQLYKARSAFETYWTTGFRNVAIVSEGPATAIEYEALRQRADALRRYDVVFAETDGLFENLRRLEVDAYHVGPAGMSRVLSEFTKYSS